MGSFTTNRGTLRPDRRDPRCLKRRLKPYPFLNTPRHAHIEADAKAPKGGAIRDMNKKSAPDRDAF